MQDLAVIRCTCAEILRAFGMTDAEGGEQTFTAVCAKVRVADKADIAPIGRLYAMLGTSAWAFGHNDNRSALHLHYSDSLMSPQRSLHDESSIVPWNSPPSGLSSGIWSIERPSGKRIPGSYRKERMTSSGRRATLP